MGVLSLDTSRRCWEANDTAKDTQPGTPDSWPMNFSLKIICWHLPLLIHKINAAIFN